MSDSAAQVRDLEGYGKKYFIYNLIYIVNIMY